MIRFTNKLVPDDTVNFPSGEVELTEPPAWWETEKHLRGDRVWVRSIATGRAFMANSDELTEVTSEDLQVGDRIKWSIATDHSENGVITNRYSHHSLGTMFDIELEAGTSVDWVSANDVTPI